MSSSHRVSVRTELSTDGEEGTAVAYATKWLLDEVGDIDVFHEVFAKPWNGYYTVTFLAQLDDDQVDAIKEADAFNYLTELD